MSSESKRNGKGFLSGTLIGALGGLIGLGGAEFRLPVLMGSFKMPTLEAVIFNKAMSLTVVAVALIFRTKSIAVDQLFAHLDIVINLLAGSLIGAWWAAGRAIKCPVSGWTEPFCSCLLSCHSSCFQKHGCLCMIAPLDYSSPESRPLLRVLLRVSSLGMWLLFWVLQEENS